MKNISRILVFSLLLLLCPVWANAQQGTALRLFSGTDAQKRLTSCRAADVFWTTDTSHLYIGSGSSCSWVDFGAGAGGGGTVTSVSVVTANGVSGSVATATTTPAITLTLGAITPTSVNGLIVTTTTGTFTLTNGKTFAVSNSLTLAGTDGTTQTFPSTNAVMARTDAGQTFTGVNVFTSPNIVTAINDTNSNPLVTVTATGSAVFGLTLANAAAGGTVALGVTAPTVAASGVAGTPVSLRASDAVAGNVNAGAVAGGAVTITAGDAKRLTSGNANGGAITLATGAGIGTGVAGQVLLPPGPDTSNNGLGFTGFTNIGIGAGSNALRFFNNGERWAVLGTGMITYSTSLLGWSSTGTVEGTMDVALYRNAAGKLEINSGTPGTYRDLLVRQHYVDQTITTGGTTGNQTINKAAGTVNIAAAGTTVTVTDNLCTTSSTVFAVIRTNDATAILKNVVPGAGSFVITLSAAATAEISIGFLVINQ